MEETYKGTPVILPIWPEAIQGFGVAFPQIMPSMFYWAFATVVVHVCQRLVEHTAFSIDPSSRRLSSSKAALWIGCIVWALDLVGLFMYADFPVHSLALWPALGGLMVMALTAKVTIPSLSTSASAKELVPTGSLLAVGMLGGHFLLTHGYIISFSQPNAVAISAAVIVAVGVCLFTSLRHRACKMRALRQSYIPQSWIDKVFCGGGIVVVHWLLLNSFPLKLSAPTHFAHDGLFLVGLLVFTLAVATEQLHNIRTDKSRQQLQRRGLSLLRAALPYHSRPEQDIQLSVIADHLPRLLHRDALRLHFQPIINIYGPRVHYEALLRLNDAQLGALSPDAFFLVCELQGKTHIADRMILLNALDTAHHWAAQGMPTSTVCVNVAPGTLLEPGFAQWICNELAHRSLPWGALQLELTEHALIASGAPMVQAIHDLRVVGVPVFMDDFGAGYSSLGVLADLPIAGIKCDRLFLRQLPTDPRRQSLLRHVVRLARELQLEVVVEGVETAEELQYVLESGIGNIQGYFFSKAIPQDEVPAWHKAYRPSEVRIQPRPMETFMSAAAPLGETEINTPIFGSGMQASSA